MYFLLALLLTMQTTGKDIVKPPELRKGDTIGLAAPAGPLSEALVRSATENLERKGYKVKLAQGSDEKRGYLAGGDKARAAAFNGLVRDPEVKAILCMRGGYGSPRILDKIDFEALRQQPKIVVGYSDITALLIAIRQRAGVVSFHGPMAREWGLNKGLTPFADKYFWEAFATESRSFADWGADRPPGMKEPMTIVEGAAEGFLVGGNLSLISSLMGTPYEIDTRESILFIEEVSEKPFRIDRMLNQLRLAGKLKQARGIVLGGFVGCEARDPEGDLSPSEIFVDYFGDLGVPVLADFPTGHIPEQVTLPIGIRVRLNATARTLTFLEPPVAARKREGVDAKKENASE